MIIIIIINYYCYYYFPLPIYRSLQEFGEIIGKNRSGFKIKEIIEKYRNIGVAWYPECVHDSKLETFLAMHKDKTLPSMTINSICNVNDRFYMKCSVANYIMLYQQTL